MKSRAPPPAQARAAAAPAAPPKARSASPATPAQIAPKSEGGGGAAPAEPPQPIVVAKASVSSVGAWAKAAAEPAPRSYYDAAAQPDLQSFRRPAKENNSFTQMFAERCDGFAKQWQQQVFRVPEDKAVVNRVLYIIRGARVPDGTWGAGFALLLDGSGSSFEAFHPGRADMPDEYQDYISFIPVLTNPMPGEPKSKSNFKMKCPVFLIDLVEALFLLALDRGLLFLLIGFSRGAMWSAWLAKMFPQHFDGVMLVGLYPLDEDDESMTKDALDLIRVVPRVSLLHGLEDDHSTIANHEPFWRIILGAEVGDGLENRCEHFKTWACMADHTNSRNVIVSRVELDSVALRATMWDNMVLPEDPRLAFKREKRPTWE